MTAGRFPRRAGFRDGASRGAAALGPLLLTLVLGACAGPTPIQDTPRDLLLQTARECELEIPGVHVWGIDRRGKVQASYRTSGEQQRFAACLQGRASERIERAMAALAPGHPVPAADGSRQTVVPIIVTGNLIRVKVVANGAIPLTLLLDTGASRTILHSAAATRLNVNPSPEAPRWPSRLADGRVIVVPYARLQSLGLGSLAIEDIDVGVYDLLPGSSSLDGVLGGEILGHFRVTIDRQSERLELEMK
jgi:predicted aspartyl protease